MGGIKTLSYVLCMSPKMTELESYNTEEHMDVAFRKQKTGDFRLSFIFTSVNIL